MRQSFHTAGCATAMRQSPTGNCAPATPTRNLHIYQQKLRRGESFSPTGSSITTPENFATTGHTGRRCRFWSAFWKRAAAGRRTASERVCSAPAVTAGWGIRTLPGNGCSGHFATAFPSRRCAVRSAAFFWKRVSIRRRRSGIISPWKRDTSPTRDSASRRAATISGDPAVRVLRPDG